MIPRMIVECGQCHTKLRMDASTISFAGAKVRCARCLHVFTVNPGGKVESNPEVHPLETSVASEAPGPPKPEAQGPPAAAFEENPEPSPTHTTASGASTRRADGKSPSLSRRRPNAQAQRPAPPQPKVPPRLSVPVRRFLTEAVSPRQRFRRIVVACGIAFFGMILGLAAMGVQPTPHYLRFLFRYGPLDYGPGLNVVHYEGQILSLEDGTRKLRVTGTVYNHSREPHASPNLKVEVLSAGGEFLAQKTESCCNAGVPSFGTASFSIELDLPQGPVGRFKVTPEK
ncbi:MAG: zinc-ribbon domain-containing protein [Pseudomonadota bacterium]